MATTLVAGKKSRKGSEQRERTVLTGIGRMMACDDENIVTVPVRMFESQQRAIEAYAAKLGVDPDVLIATGVHTLLCGGNQGDFIVREMIEAVDPTTWDEVRNDCEDRCVELLEDAEKSL